MVKRVAQTLAEKWVTVYQSPDPSSIACYSPGIARLPGGRLLATIDIMGIGLEQLGGSKGIRNGKEIQGKLLISDDGGQTWQQQLDFPLMHARPFACGSNVYILGHCQDLMIIQSGDGGNTWSEPIKLTIGEQWHQAPCNVHYANGCVYIVMERFAASDVSGWPVSVIAPVTMRGRMDADLTIRENWTFASELVFRDAVAVSELDYFGVPFFPTLPKETMEVAPGRHCAPIGWLETNIVQFQDPNHYWYDPSGRTFHLWSRAHTGGTGYAAIAKVVEHEDGSMTTMLETVPSGKTILYVPCPGGQMKFHIVYDDVSQMFWLLSTQATDSMTRAELLPKDRYGLPNNERQRLQLHFSRNCIDWCFAGMVAMVADNKQSRHYASMVIDGEHLHVLSRSGDEHAKNAHDGNLITLHTVSNFRGLIY
ncbi:sialidase family protein [Paenibacillus sp. FSL H8-0034]|uniref:sialidase family protein n=1 Tax=Paenibacillus sp. FSL H8-0034 TaxID=2954671 RepID=UPI0030F81DA6